MIKPFTLLNLLALCLILFYPITALATESAADFELPNLEGKTARLSDYRGKIIVLKLATTWCPTCTQQSEELLSSSKLLADKDIVVVDVFLQDSEQMAREFLSDKKGDFSHVALMDDGRVRTAYNVFMIPRLLLIDRDFKIRRDGNFISSKDLQREITLLLKEEKR